jgi:hypothetical protein
MRRRRTCRFLLFCFMLTCGYAGVGKAHGRQKEAWAGLERSSYGFFVPAPISRQDVDRYGAILVLSDAQRAYVGHLFGSYLDRCDALRKKWVPLLIEAASPLDQRAQTRDFSLTLTYAAQYEGVCEQETAFAAAIEREDDSFLGQISAVLADVQLPAMDRVRLHRQRSRAVTYYFRLAKARMDLSRLVERYGFPEEILRNLEPVMCEYEQAVTPEFVKASNRYRDSRAKCTRLSLRQELDDNGQPRDLTNPIVIDQIRAFRQQKLALLHSRTDAEMQIARVNDQFLPKFLEQMPLKLSKEFRLVYLSTAYRRVYPDKSDPQELYEGLLADRHVDDNICNMLAEQWQAYRRQYENLCARMRDSADEWAAQFARFNSNEGWEEYESRMEFLARERISKNEQFVKSIIELLPPPIRARHQETIDRWRNEVDEYRNSADILARHYPATD